MKSYGIDSQTTCTCIIADQDGHWYGSCEEGNSIYGRHIMSLSTCAN